jgi:hypothetical protein
MVTEFRAQSVRIREISVSTGRQASGNRKVFLPTIRVTTVMKTNQASTNRSHPGKRQYALRREADSWEVTFQGRQATFNHELGALYVAYLLLHPSREPIHGVALALNARDTLGQPPSPAEALPELVMGLEDAASVRALWRRQRELERVLADRLESDPVKAEALRELEQVTEHLRQSPWLSRHSAERCARAVGVAIKRLHARLASAVDASGKPDAVLRTFALHLHKHLLLPSGRGSVIPGPEPGRCPAASSTCRLRESCGKSKVQSRTTGCPGRTTKGEVRSPRSKFKLLSSSRAFLLPRWVTCRGSCAPPLR